MPGIAERYQRSRIAATQEFMSIRQMMEEQKAREKQRDDAEYTQLDAYVSNPDTWRQFPKEAIKPYYARMNMIRQKHGLPPVVETNPFHKISSDAMEKVIPLVASGKVAPEAGAAIFRRMVNFDPFLEEQSFLHQSAPQQPAAGEKPAKEGEAPQSGVSPARAGHLPFMEDITQQLMAFRPADPPSFDEAGEILNLKVAAILQRLKAGKIDPEQAFKEAQIHANTAQESNYFVDTPTLRTMLIPSKKDLDTELKGLWAKRDQGVLEPQDVYDYSRNLHLAREWSLEPADIRQYADQLMQTLLTAPATQAADRARGEAAGEQAVAMEQFWAWATTKHGAAALIDPVTKQLKTHFTDPETQFYFQKMSGGMNLAQTTQAWEDKTSEERRVKAEAFDQEMARKRQGLSEENLKLATRTADRLTDAVYSEDAKALAKALQEAIMEKNKANRELAAMLEARVGPLEVAQQKNIVAELWRQIKAARKEAEALEKEGMQNPAAGQLRGDELRRQAGY